MQNMIDVMSKVVLFMSQYNWSYEESDNTYASRGVVMRQTGINHKHFKLMEEFNSILLKSMKWRVVQQTSTE